MYKSAFSHFTDVIDKALELPEETRKNAGEMVALKCLEGLFDPLNYIGENGPPTQEPKVTFDSSKSCEHVVKRICKEVILFQNLVVDF